jgi:long-chain acyl-CoA synthetase
MRKYDDPRLMEADRLAEMGRARAAREVGLYDRLVDATKSAASSMILRTNPKRLPGDHAQAAR